MHDPGTNRSSHSDTLKVVLIYALFGSLWILFSDQMVESLPTTHETHMILQTVKGWLFVAVTSLLLYYLLRRIEHRQHVHQAPAQYGGIVNWKRWQLYLFAITITLFALILRESIGVQFGMRPMLIMLIFPIILSAALGGFGPGLLSTGIATLYAAYYFTPAAGAARFHLPLDLLPTGFMIVNGLLVSYLSMMLHEARYRSEQARRQAEASLEEKMHATRLLDSIADSSPDAIFAKDTDGLYLLCNSAAAGFAGRPALEILGKDDAAILPPEQAALILRNDR